MPGTLHSYLKFAYGSFLKPHDGDGGGSQQDALESFYRPQADAYDTTRTALLRGRDDMIQLVAAQMKHKNHRHRPIWVDIGGGTGWNIEQMGKHVHVPSFFGEVFLVDLSPSLLKIAEERFKKLGWTNVKTICIDCRYFDLARYMKDSNSSTTSTADLITMSYSLTMIPDFFPIIDMTISLLAPTGIFGVVDFYAQTSVEFMGRDYVGGFLDRHCTWLNRTFWRTWFEQDRVMFDGGRRDYLEYRFGTKVSINKRNAMIPGLRIPYYIWIGCPRHSASIAEEDQSPAFTSFESAPEGLKRPDVPLPSSYYQNTPWRTYYKDPATPQKQDSSSPCWSNAELDAVLPSMAITSSDTVLAYGCANDAVLSIAIKRPKMIHVMDTNVSRNHLLEFSLAACRTLNDDELLSLFQPDRSSNLDYKHTLIDRLSPYLSSHALQFFFNHGPGGWLSGNISRPNLKSLSIAQHRDLSKILTFGDKSYDQIRIHTTYIEQVLPRLDNGSLSVILLAEDFPSAGASSVTADDLFKHLNRVLVLKGRVLFKTAAIDGRPWQITSMEMAGFVAECCGLRSWLCVKTREVPVSRLNVT